MTSGSINIGKILERKGLLTRDSIFKDIVENKAVRQTSKIFLAVLFISGTLVLSAAAPNLFKELGRLKRMFAGKEKENRNRIQRQKMMQTIYNLRNRKLIEWDRRGDKIILRLTSSGKANFINNYLYDIKIKKQEKWDKVWRIVAFDVPNNKTTQRNILRERLKRLGFYQFQKSAFVSPHPCKNELEAVLEYYQLFDYVTYIEASYISGEERCRQYFEI